MHVAIDREVVVVAAVLEAGSEKAAAHRLGVSHSTVKHHLANARLKVRAETTAQLVWILADWLPSPRALCGADRLLRPTAGGSADTLRRARQAEIDVSIRAAGGAKDGAS